MALFASGANYSVELIRSVAIFRVFVRPDLSREQGAQLAEEMISVFKRLAGMPLKQVRGLKFDLREATKQWGPATQNSIDQMLAVFEGARRRVAVISSTDPIQIILIKQTLRRVARNYGTICASDAEADLWCAGG